MTFPVLLLASLLGVFDGSNHIGVTWDDANGDARFALADARAQAITSSIVVGHGEPRIAFDGSLYFVAWVDVNGLEVQRLSRDGDLLGPPIASRRRRRRPPSPRSRTASRWCGRSRATPSAEASCCATVRLPSDCRSPATRWSCGRGGSRTTAGATSFFIGSTSGR